MVRLKVALLAELAAGKVLVNSGILPDSALSDEFMRAGLVFLNGFRCVNEFLQVFPGDFFQVVAGLKCYILRKWAMS